MPTLDDVSFDTASLLYQGEEDGLREWSTAAGDGVWLHYFPIPPDIAADVSDPRTLRQFYRSRVAAATVLISLDTVTIQGTQCVHLITKVPQQLSGMTYLGTLTIPFRDFGFVLKVQALEYGTTGVRETLMLNELLKAGAVTIDVESKTLRGWTHDPYDSGRRDGSFPNLAEDEAYDARFPDHPLSRVRLLLRHLTAGVTLSSPMRALPPFAYPPVATHRPWWRIW